MAQYLCGLKLLRCPINMYHQQMQLELLGLMNEPYDVGKKKKKSRQSVLSEVKDVTTSQHLQLNLFDAPLSTPESQAQSNEKIYSVNVIISNLNTLTQKLSQKLEEVLTTKERSFSPYWSELCKEISSVLLSRIKTDSQDLVSISSLGSVPLTLAKSWFSTKLNYLPNVKWLKTSLQSSTASQQDCTDSESTSLKSLKIRIYPEQKLHQIWKKWLAATKYCYNEALSYLRKHGKVSKYDLRKLILRNAPKWVQEVPYNPKGEAVIDAYDGFISSRKKGTKQREAGKFRSWRDAKRAIKFQPENYSNGTWYSDEVKGLSFETSEALPAKDIEYQAKQKDKSFKLRVRKQTWGQSTQLVYDKKRWFAVFPVEFTPQLSDKQTMIALDPGVRSFLTGFDGEKFIDIGSNDITKIYRLCRFIDGLISQKSKLKGRLNKRRRQKTQAKIDSLFIRVRNLIDECHKKVAKWLTSEYRLIFLPTFETSQMVAKTGNKKRKINSKTVRQILRWSHFRFKQTLKFQALKRGCTVMDVTEEYTSKTCTKCGHVHVKLGSSKKFKCPSCGYKLPRDWNGALGIFLKALRDIAELGASVSSTLCPEIS
jgi:putative transposase